MDRIPDTKLRVHLGALVHRPHRPDFEQVVFLHRPERGGVCHKRRQVQPVPAAANAYGCAKTRPRAAVDSVLQFGQPIGIRLCVAEDAIEGGDRLAQIVDVIAEAVRMVAQRVRVVVQRVRVVVQAVGVACQIVRMTI